MPLQLLDYDTILGVPKKSRLPINKYQYNIFGHTVISILQSNSERDGIHECEFMADLRKMGRLLGNGYELMTMRKGRNFPKIQLKQMITARRATCILDGTYRYIVVRAKKLP